ncbi:zinc finger protein ZAT5 [Andrographis paniculata]|uniref:zinc finger protein ZAT5 n=1 Tax=Andrographis paniculata TaxID=175694 RepID=UPI0021E8DD92|nr:zinc finger protein ZAT5 [Andrographis paniculata]
MDDREEQLLAMVNKGKRSKRPRPESPPAVSSSSTAADQGGGRNDVVLSSIDQFYGEDEDMANCLILLAKGAQGEKSPAAAVAEVAAAGGGGAYQCKTCNKSFPSFQALGGHRASHTKPVKEEKKTVTVTEKHKRLLQSYGESTILSLQIPAVNLPGKAAGRVHECSICGAEFASGQALGGHMRRHRPIPAADAKRPRNLPPLDLNLPAPPEDHGEKTESAFPFAAKQQVIVFSAASPMVDCHY